MQRTTARLFLLVAALAATGLMPAGCKKSSSAGPEPRVELSDAKVTLTGPMAWKASVKYRFVQGRPSAGFWYRCDVNASYGPGKAGIAALLDSEGNGLQPEGVLEKDFGLYKPVEKGDVFTYEIVMTGGPNRQQLSPISNVLKGTAQ
jgi:hypothetical protein